jgi:hypothetical protein
MIAPLIFDLAKSKSILLIFFLLNPFKLFFSAFDFFLSLDFVFLAILSFYNRFDPELSLMIYSDWLDMRFL